MYHSITIGDKNTWDDWHLIPTSRPAIAPPPVRTKFIDIPGGNGALDLTEALSGGPTYGNRTGSISFYVMHEYWPIWTKTYSEIMAYLHGRAYERTILEDDPSWFYTGRWSVNQYQSGASYSQVTLNYTLSPFKKSITALGEDWLWDPFNFETDVITGSTDTFTATSAGTTVTLYGYGEPVTPTFKVLSGTLSSVTVNGTVYTLSNYTAGKSYYNPSIKMAAGNNTIVLKGNNASVQIVYRGGML